MRTWLALVAVVLSSLAQAAPVAPAPNHPILGIWELRLPDSPCAETYRFRADGTTLVFSAEEVSESEYLIDAKPTARGYYKLSDRLVKDNGKPDCGGQVMKIGTATTNYVRFNTDNTVFVMCVAESLEACIGPFRRVEGQDT
ncbi:MAG TPA: hypothetical protein VFF16_14480 [Telluria sp.]|nr:hypothetical protein [Telluria sp.]